MRKYEPMTAEERKELKAKIDKAMKEFLARGGKIEKVTYPKFDPTPLKPGELF